MKSKRYYTERVVYMLDLAQKAQTEALRKSCLKAAEAYQILADTVGAPESDDDKE